MSENRVDTENSSEIDKKITLTYTVVGTNGIPTASVILPNTSRSMIQPKLEDDELNREMDASMLIFQPQIPSFMLETIASNHMTHSMPEDKHVNVKEEPPISQSLQPPYYCSLCNKKFTRQSNLTEHLSRHNGDVHTCSLCQKSFSCNRYLVRHLRIHKYDGAKKESNSNRQSSKPKTYSCTYCEKKFSCKSHVVAHTRLHTGEKPYSCHICKKKFNYKSRLTTHNRVHTGEKPFSCRVCKKTFRDASNLAGHVKIHGVKAFECDYCHEQFSNRTELKMHEKGVVGKKQGIIHMCTRPS